VNIFERAELGRKYMRKRFWVVQATWAAAQANRAMRKLYGTREPAATLIEELGHLPLIKRYAGCCEELKSEGPDPAVLDRMICQDLEKENRP